MKCILLIRPLLVCTFIVGLLLYKTGCSKEDEPELRRQAIRDYHENYIGSFVSDPGWTGNINGCREGTITDFARQKVIQRLNYFRRMVGLSDDLVENLSQHEGCQKASLIFKAQNDLSHFPSASWACYTPEGADAAATSNIAWGTSMTGEWSVHTTYGITGFIEDPGDNNTRVGHRAWFFLPGLHSVGIGSTNTTSCIQWKGNYSPGGQSPEFIAYPPGGYIPNTLVFPRWSFSVPAGTAGYEDAIVTMQDESGGAVTLTIVNKPSSSPGSLPLPQLVWEPEVSFENIKRDQKVTVTIENITGVTQSSYSYDVIVVPVIRVSKRIAVEGSDDRIFLPVWRLHTSFP